MDRPKSIRAFAAALLLAGCSPEAAPDSRFVTPEATLRSLMRARRFDRMTDEALREHIKSPTASEEQADMNLYRQCFLDFEPTRPIDIALAGWVLGALAAARNDWRTVRVDDRVDVLVGDRDRIVLRTTSAGWKISLRDSIRPAERQRIETLIDEVQVQAREEVDRIRAERRSKGSLPPSPK